MLGFRPVSRFPILLATVAGLLALLALAPACREAEAGDLPVHVPDATVERSAVPEVYHWDLTPLFAGDEAWEKERAAVETEIARLDSCRGKLADPAGLKRCLNLYFGLHDRANHVTLYAALRLTTAQSDDALQSRGAPTAFPGPNGPFQEDLDRVERPGRSVHRARRLASGHRRR